MPYSAAFFSATAIMAGLISHPVRVEIPRALATSSPTYPGPGPTSSSSPGFRPQASMSDTPFQPLSRISRANPSNISTVISS